MGFTDLPICGPVDHAQWYRFDRLLIVSSGGSVGNTHRDVYVGVARRVRRAVAGVPARRALAVVAAAALVAATLAVLPLVPAPTSAAGPCDPPIANPVACENTKPGTPPSQWFTTSDESIQGFPTDISTNVGGTVRFKINTPSTSYSIDIYRIGWYQGNGARKVASISPSATLPQSQPACLSDPTTGLVDCGNWGVSASWDVPADAVSGLYFAYLNRNDASADNVIPFVVRQDSSTSKVLFQTSDTTWQAYNRYGGNSLYFGNPVGRAYKVSYNRPLRGASEENELWNAEYPMIRWLERNGYDVSYQSGIDTDRLGAANIQHHQVFLTAGHDEYWSGNQRANVEAARDAGVNMAFFSGNDVFWKTRYEPSIDGSGTTYRTLVCYKGTHDNAQIDPTGIWTGTWRDPRFSPPADGGRPENALLGTIFTVNGVRNDAITVPAAYKGMRLWRNTSITSLPTGGVATFPVGTLGYEWNSDLDNGFRPKGLIDLSSTTITMDGDYVIQDNGSNYGPGTATHNLTLYRAASGALVFSAGTVQWAWGLDSEHSRGDEPADPRMQQATVNLFADMGVQPATLQSGLVAATASTDTTAPTATITSPAAGATVYTGQAVTISGTATDVGGGVVGGVEVSVDGGTTWHPAQGTTSWSYAWTPTQTGSMSILARATDDSVNTQSTPVSRAVDVTFQCPCTIFGNQVPNTPSVTDTTPTEVGVKFRSDVAGQVTGVRFYKGTGNTGTHTGHLWTSTGTLLATVTFAGETGSGWQTANFPSPVSIDANTTYVVSYFAPNGRVAGDNNAFTNAGADVAPLHALKSGVDGANGVYNDGGSGFPTSSYRDSNYWVDVVMSADNGPDTTPPTVTARVPADGATGVNVGVKPTAVFSEAVQPSTVSIAVTGPGGQAVPGTVAYDAGALAATFTPTALLATSTAYTVTVSGAKDLAGNTMAPTSWGFTTAGVATCPCSIWSSDTVPTNAASSDGAAVEVGVKFRYAAAGLVSGIRFYKGAGNTGTHVGNLWTSSGQLLATGTFVNETTTGWQTLTFANPVAIAANTTYVASYFAPNGHYAWDANYFTASGYDNPPVSALQSGADGPNGVYRYGANSGFPTDSYQGTNYWVDVVVGPDNTPPIVTATTPGSGATGVSIGAKASATFSKPVQPATVTFELRNASNQVVPGSSSVDPANTVATFTPSSALSSGATYTATVSGAKDQQNNTMSPHSWSFTVGGPAACPCSIFSSDQAPAAGSSADVTPTEVGVKFRATTSGFVTGVRFYKGTANTGTHVGSLWTTSGQLLASATFTGETASGWQSVQFGAAVPVTAGTTYVASYYAPNGRYAATLDGFAAAGIDNPPLSALQSGVDGSNGVYRSGSTGFPNDSYRSTNYWVDVTFTPGSAVPVTVTDTTSTQFLAGTVAGTAVTESLDGEVSLAPAAGAEMYGSSLPAGFSSAPSRSGGTARVSAGLLSVEGARAYSTSPFGVGRTLTFRAFFRAGAAEQVAGLGGTGSAGPPWAVFSTRGGGRLWARTAASGSSYADTSLGTAALGGWHVFAITWNPGSVIYSIDGTVVANHAVAPAGPLGVLVGDRRVEGRPLQVDWIRLGPFAATGTFTSRVFDSGGATTWTSGSWLQDVPAGASLSVSVRAGSTPVPDGTWGAFAPVSSGGPVNASGRYLQYQVTMAPSPAGDPPFLSSISFLGTQ